VLGDAFGLEGYECRLAANGQAALSTLQEWSPDVIVLDLMMPVMDGWAFRREQRANPAICDIPVVVVSASRTDDELGAVVIVPKPFELDMLLKTLAQLVNDRSRSARAA
jgi:two-component system chemotaxis response regulator CheY